MAQLWSTLVNLPFALMQMTVAFMCNLCDLLLALRIGRALWSSTDTWNMAMSPENDLNATTTTSTWASQATLQQKISVFLLSEGILHQPENTHSTPSLRASVQGGPPLTPWALQLPWG